jgi:hypothetical protein
MTSKINALFLHPSSRYLVHKQPCPTFPSQCEHAYGRKRGSGASGSDCDDAIADRSDPPVA